MAAAALVAASAPTVRAQQAPPPPATGPGTTQCGQPVPPPRSLPPAGSGPVVYTLAPCFEAQGGQSVVDPQTYLYYIQLKPSRPSEGVWVPYDDTAEKTILTDFRRLWATNFLDNLWIEVQDYTFSNGVIGKMVTYNMEERQRVKIVDYVGSKEIEVTKIDEKLKEVDATIRLDTFIDPGLVRKVEGVVREMMKEKGFEYATVTHAIKEVPGGPKIVHLTFKIDEGPKVKIRTIEFVGNHAVGSGTLRRQMKANKQRGLWTRLTGRDSYQATKFEEDAERMVAYYRDRGYVKVVVGTPELTVIGDSSDKKTRWVQLRVPITEGARYRIGEFSFEGNTVIKSEALRPMFADLKGGDFYSEKDVRKGLEKAREVYGVGGYFEFTGYPDLRPRDDVTMEPEVPPALAADVPATKPAGPPIVDVVMRMQEGKQYFVNRIVFVGNHTTHDNVIRREVRLLEGGVFNTEAMKYSIRRLNQLGYFKPLEAGRDVGIDKTPGADNKVDVKVRLEEQNRNQLTFGAGVSQYEGFFGQTSFTTSNFMGRGESLTVSVQTGSRAQNYQLGFTEPFLFERNITGGINVFKSQIRYISQFTQQTAGGVVTFGFPVGGFGRLYTNYSYTQVKVTELNTDVLTPAILAVNPFLHDSLMIGQGGARTISKITPSYVFNTVDNPIFPTSGRRLTLGVDFAGLGGDTDFYRPTVEAVWFIRHLSRLSLGMRGQMSYIHELTGSKSIPISELIFLGGEYSVRGFDIRTIGPQDPVTHLVLGGNKSLLFNIEESITMTEMVRLVLFFDAGQVQAGPRIVEAPAFVPAGGVLAPTVTPGTNFAWRDFKTSTGVEVRFMMPVLNVPFRLIMAYNPHRDGVFDNTLQPQRAFQFRFAVGSTF